MSPDAAILAEVKRRLNGYASKKATVKMVCIRVEKNLCPVCGIICSKMQRHLKAEHDGRAVGPYDLRDVERVVGAAIKAGELHVTDGYVWVPGPPPAFGSEVKGARKKKAAPEDKRQVGLFG